MATRCGNTAAARSRKVSGVSGWKFAGLRSRFASKIVLVMAMQAPRKSIIPNPRTAQDENQQPNQKDRARPQAGAPPAAGCADDADRARMADRRTGTVAPLFGQNIFDSSRT